ARDLQKQLRDRVGQCVLTCAGTACFAGLREGAPLKLGGALRYFGDGHQISKRLGERRYWRVPVMDGEFLCDDSVGTTKAVGGGNILILGASRPAVLAAAEAAVAAVPAVAAGLLTF